MKIRIQRLSLFVAGLMLMGCIAVPGGRASGQEYLRTERTYYDGSPVTQGDGSLENPFLVYDEDTLKKIGTGLDGWGLWVNYKQIYDIDMGGVTDFKPIGNESGFFGGTFDGGGMVIDNLSIEQDNTESQYMGLFGGAMIGGIKNVNLYNASFVGTDSTPYVWDQPDDSIVFGGVAGYAEAMTVENCYVYGDIRAKALFAGGIVGNAYNAQVVNCVSELKISGEGGVIFIGGSISRAGGVVAYMTNDSSVTGCIFTEQGEIKGDIFTSGGIVGYAENSTVNNCPSRGNVKGRVNIGGILGNGVDVRVENSDFSGFVAVEIDGGGGMLGGIVGFLLGESGITNCNFTKDAILHDNNSMSFGGIVGRIEGVSEWVDLDMVSRGAVKIENCTVEGEVEIPGGVPLGTTGIGGVVGRATIDTLEIINSHFTGNLYTKKGNAQIGGIIGHSENKDLKIIECTYTGTITREDGEYDSIGGILGTTGDALNAWGGGRQDVLIRDCHVRGTIDVQGVATVTGGIAAYTLGDVNVTGCSFVGDIYHDSIVSPSGGIIGNVYGKLDITNSYTKGNIMGRALESADVFDIGFSGAIGGLVGEYSASGVIDSCYSTMDVHGGVDGFGMSAVGGLVGTISDVYQQTELASITNSFSTGDVTGSGWAVGGILGGSSNYDGIQPGEIHNCYSTGRVSLLRNASARHIGEYASVGGIVGWAEPDMIIENCAALNKAVVTNIPFYDMGRVVGAYALDKDPAVLRNNVAYDRMAVIANGTDKTLDIGQDTYDGADVCPYEVVLTALFQGLFDAPEGVWTFEIGKLPGLFGSSVQMPTHIVAPKIEGASRLSLTVGYSGTATGAYTFSGADLLITEKIDYGAYIVWDELNSKFNINSGLTAGSYSGVLRASNCNHPEHILVHQLTVTVNNPAPIVIPPTSTPEPPVPSIEPTPTPEPEPSVEPTPTPEPVPSVKPTQTPEQQKPSVEPTPTPEPEPSVKPTQTPEQQKPSVKPTQTPEQKPSVKPTQTPEQKPSVKPTQTPEQQPSVEPTSTPEAQPDDEPSPTPEPEEREIFKRVPTTSPTIDIVPTVPGDSRECKCLYCWCLLAWIFLALFIITASLWGWRECRWKKKFQRGLNVSQNDTPGSSAAGDGEIHKEGLRDE